MEVQLRSIRNPFLTQVMPDPWARAEGDVPQINQPVFDLCCDLVQETLVGAGSTCLLIYGEAGSGKTHLLSRLRSHLESSSAAVFFAIRLQTVAPRIWRHIRRAIATDLLRPYEGKTRLDHLLAREKPPLEERIGFSYGLANVLKQFREGRYRSQCAAWLRGEPLPESMLTKLSIAVDDEEDVSLEDQSNQVVLHLCRLLAPLPVVLCFDQVEALETVPGDLSGLHAFGKAVADLHAELSNMVAISAMQSSFAIRLEENLDRYIYDRLSLHRAEIQPLNSTQGNELLTARMDSDTNLAWLRAQHTSHSMWPFAQDTFTSQFGAEDLCTARRLVHAAAGQFETIARGSADLPDVRTVNDFLNQEFKVRRERALAAEGTLDAEDLLLATLPVLLGFATRPEQPGRFFVAGSPEKKVAIQLLNQPHANAVVHRLKSIQKEWDPAAGHPPLILLRTAKLPISVKATKTRTLLAELTRKGARLVQPSAEVLAALEAFRSLVADAQTGNLGHLGEDISPVTVQEWFRGQMPPVVEDFLEEFTSDPPQTGQDFATELLELLEVRSIVKLEEAAHVLGASPEQLSEYARHHPLQVGFLAGPPPVLFHSFPSPIGNPDGAD